MPPKIKITPEQIIKAAFEITREKGIESVTAAAVAKRLGCSTQPIYWSFSTMQGLRGEVIKEANREYNKYIFMPVENVPPYKATGINYIRFAREQPQLFILLYMTDRQNGRDIGDSMLDDNRQEIIEIISGQTGLEFEKAELLYVDMWVFSHGIASMIATNTAGYTDETIGKMLTRAYRGFLTQLKGNE